MVDLTKIPGKWQKKWENAKVFEVKEDSKKKKYYVLEMYPYPSGSGLHMGHARNYCIGDVYARFKRMSGFNVLYPMGYDSFGLPAENAAIQAKSHPKIFTEKAINSFVKQQKELGLSYDWSRMIMSHSPEYYRWDQWIFIKMHEKGLAYKKKSSVNWCPKCNTVLANEQVHSGKCWRHTETEVEPKDLDQWFFKITNYAEELLKDIDKLKEWSEDVKIMQRNWIGKSKGTLMDFPIKDSAKKLTVFTTRPDTFYGITFLVYAPEHPDVQELIKGRKEEEKVQKFIKKVIKEDRFERTAENKEKEGMFIGRYAINPITKEEIPIYIANFVLHEYGTGAIIAVPAHDQRDFEFAKKYDIPIKVILNPPDYELNAEKMSRAYMGDGIICNSQQFDGMNNRDAIDEITKFLEKNKCGRFTTQYKLRDWLLSRQRFWGCPIPIVYCDDCGIVPVSEKDLPVKLPDNVKFGGKGNPLEQCKDFVDTKCPKCKGKARRETDTMDTFIDSSWYFLRYCDPKNDKAPFDNKKAKYWMPMDIYIGGKEHACMHLIYFRYFTKFLRDIGLLDIDEPAPRLFNQGMLHKGGFVMSKSRGNVVTQEEIANKYGIDTARLFLVFVSSPDKDMEWDDKGVEGSFRFLNKVYSLYENKTVENNKSIESKTNATIKNVTEKIEKMQYNSAVIDIMQFVNFLHKKGASKDALKSLALLISPFCPHIAEEVWEKIGEKGFVSIARWPKFDARKIDAKEDAKEAIVSIVQSDINSVLKLAGIEKPKKIRLFVAEKWKYDLFSQLKKELEKTRDLGQIMKNVMKGELKKYGKEISKIIPRLLNDTSKIPIVILDDKTEMKALEEAKQEIGSEFKCIVEVKLAGKSEEQKAKQAMPGKAAILVE
ncbi:MAG: leucine--tRNA ligase [Candidatus Woesearchaeota archaeon]